MPQPPHPADAAPRTPRVDSPTAWRCRVLVLDHDGSLLSPSEQILSRSFTGVRRVFERCFSGALETQRHGPADALELETSFRELGAGDFALWFDAHDRRSPLSRWLTDQQRWESLVDTLLGAASEELVALCRAAAMMGDSDTGDLLVRPLPGPEGPQARMEVSDTGRRPARMSRGLWDWAHEHQGRTALRDLLSLVLVPGCARVEVRLFEGRENEQRMSLGASPRVQSFVLNDSPLEGVERGLLE